MHSEHPSSSESSAGSEPRPTRRGLLEWLSYVLGALATAAVGVPILGYFLAPVFRRPPDDWIDVGSVADFPPNQTRMVKFVNPKPQPWDGLTKQSAAYVRHLEDGNFLIFAVNCAHLGCPVSWFPQSGLFLCPCHGGVYYENGDRASGPPPRGLYQYDYRIVKKDRREAIEIWAGHLPTLQDTPEKTAPKSKAEGQA